MASDCVLVLTTLGTAANPAAFAAILVEERLAACVNVLPDMESVYRWQGRIERDREHQLVIKTTSARLDALRRRMDELHPYEVPELIVLPIVDGGTAYLEWLREETSAQPPDK